ncbi:hypothetical protein GCM10008957_43610 [Deinococcus ruber]|uniref:Uncharacterized protein n=1 Tax=Deinococcus ruber TaxID=1848197 RepID=A0A918CJB6_9DEIO|nr:hypothetical protein GCM10008957_43610 [Deinococcus ruber]
MLETVVLRFGLQQALHAGQAGVAGGFAVLMQLVKGSVGLSKRSGPRTLGSVVDGTFRELVFGLRVFCLEADSAQLSTRSNEGISLVLRLMDGRSDDVGRLAASQGGHQHLSLGRCSMICHPTNGWWRCRGDPARARVAVLPCDHVVREECGAAEVSMYGRYTLLERD